MAKLSPQTSINDLLEEHPSLVDFLAEYNPMFSMLKNPAMRNTVGKTATLEKAAGMGGVDLDGLLSALEGEIQRLTSGGKPEQDKVAELKSLIRDLHDGVAPETAKSRFDTVIKDVTPKEIAAMEEQLIREGLPVEEIQRLCDLHVAVVQDSLDNQQVVAAPPGHPVHTYLAENEIITELSNAVGELCSDKARAEMEGEAWASALQSALDGISGIHNHYLRKENELFPVLERHGVTGPSQVMWGIHDEIRAQLKEAKALLSGGSLPEAATTATALARAVVEMGYKENKILFPLALQSLTHEEWGDIRMGEDELGYGFQAPEAPFPDAGPASGKPISGQVQPRTQGLGGAIGLPIVSAAATAPLPEATDQAYVDLGTGRLSVEQVDLILRHLPIECSFVDADGFVRYYSDTEERLFPRTPGAIGRHVKNCHPPKSVHMVQEILRKFAEGEREVAEFWIQMQERFIHIRYFAVRNAAKEYLGCLEVTQDVTEIRALEGQQRLLDWS